MFLQFYTSFYAELLYISICILYNRPIIFLKGRKSVRFFIGKRFFLW